MDFPCCAGEFVAIALRRRERGAERMRVAVHRLRCRGIAWIGYVRSGAVGMHGECCHDPHGKCSCRKSQLISRRHTTLPWVVVMVDRGSQMKIMINNPQVISLKH